MAVIRVQRITMPKSGLPKDQTVNVFHFLMGVGTATPAGADLDQISTALDTFFNTPVGGGTAIRVYIGETTMATQRVTYKMFNMDDASPRVPIRTPVAANPTPATSAQPLPAEIAACLSFRGAVISGVAPARRRGRVFIGPLNTSALVIEAATGQPRIDTACSASCVAAANRMHDDLFTLGISWGIYSPTQRGSGPAADGFTPAVYAWMDNAFDTQRRRGPASTSRATIDM